MLPITRRELLQRSSLGLGWLVLLGWLGKEDRRLARDGEPVRHLEARGPARRVIFIHHGGGVVAEALA